MRWSLRPAGLDRNCGCHWQRGRLSSRTRFRGLGWRRATAILRRGRDFAAWVGVVPRQYSTGGKQKLFGISKRGNIYLRRMLIHGARAVLFRVNYDSGGFGQWVHRLAQRAPRNKVVVAIANKLARMAWSVLSSGKQYRHQPLQPAAA